MSGSSGRDRTTESERRRRLAAMLDAAVPESTRDDQPEGTPGDRPEARQQSGDERLRREVPPHHG